MKGICSALCSPGLSKKLTITRFVLFLTLSNDRVDRFALYRTSFITFNPRPIRLRSIFWFLLRASPAVIELFNCWRCWLYWSGCFYWWRWGYHNFLAPIGLGTAQPSLLRFEESIMGMEGSRLDIGIGRDMLACLTKTSYWYWDWEIWGSVGGDISNRDTALCSHQMVVDGSLNESPDRGCARRDYLACRRGRLDFQAAVLIL